jgi:hypothetical protein
MRTCLFIGALALLGLAGCNAWSLAGERGQQTDSGQRILFEMEYVNFAWGHQHRGFYVDSDGGVWTYDVSGTPWEPARHDAYTLEELEAKYGSRREPLTTVPARKIEEMRRLIESASRGGLTEPVGNCADFGSITYRAFEYDADGSLYRPVLLYQAGDVALKNTSLSAARITGWLMEIGGSNAADQACAP